jgi:hypothetical protein
LLGADCVNCLETTMTDPVRKLRLEEIPIPDDLWDKVKRRSPVPPSREPARRVLAIALALLLAAGGIALVIHAFPRGAGPIERRTPASPADVPPQTASSPGTRTVSLVQGMTLTRPSNWTLTHLPGEENGAWPLLLLTNYDPGLDVDALCPRAAGLPADGVLLYVEMDLADEAAGYPPWPVKPEGGEKGPGTCGTGLHPRWTMGASAFEGYLAFGPKARDRDHRLLLDAFASLDLRDRGRIVFWHDLERYSGLSANPLFAEAAHVLLSLDPTGRFDGYGRFFKLLDFSGSLVREEPGGFTELEPFKPGEHIEFGGDHMQGHSGIVDGSVIASADVARVEIQAKDGRVIPCRLWPPAAGFRFGQFEFEEPLVGEFVAYDEFGTVLDRERYALWPP